jgi:ABC-type multidrug transport system fused ATPase/permease subunit
MRVQVVTEALERIMAGRTILVIAHRLSTVRGADQILVRGEERERERGEGGGEGGGLQCGSR